MRYIKQRDQSSCVSIAIINALKLLGIPMTYIDIPSWRIAFNTTTDGVSEAHWLAVTMDELRYRDANPFFVRRIDKISLFAHLHDNYGIIASLPADKEDHVVLIDRLSESEKSVNIVNWMPIENGYFELPAITQRYVSATELDKYFNHSKGVDVIIFNKK